MFPSPPPRLSPSPQQLLLPLHPSTDKIPTYWTYFKENCNLIKIFHLPTTESMIIHLTTQLDCISHSQEVLLFAIYFATAVSMPSEECLRVLGGEKDLLLRLYRYAIEQSLANAQFRESNEPVIIQALFVFITSLKRHCDSSIVWALTSITVQLSQKMSLNHDGSYLGYSPFITELRRRLWWGVSWLDARASEDSGYSRMLQSANPVPLPLNVDDCDLYPSMLTLPESKSEWSEMTFTRTMFEAVSVSGHLTTGSNKDVTRDQMAELTQDINTRNKHVMQYQDCIPGLLANGHGADLFTEFASICTWITLNKLWLLAYYPYLFNGSSVQLPQITRRSLLLISLHVVEMSAVLYQQKKFQKWRWLAETYPQCPALTYILLELCRKNEEDLEERAWNAINVMLEQSLGRFQGGDQKGLAEDLEFGQTMNTADPCFPEYELLNKLLRRARAENEKKTWLAKWNPCIGEEEQRPVLFPIPQISNGHQIKLHDLDYIPELTLSHMRCEDGETLRSVPNCLDVGTITNNYSCTTWDMALSAGMQLYLDDIFNI